MLQLLAHVSGAFIVVSLLLTYNIVWSTDQNDPLRIWLVSRPSTLLCHLRDCDMHPDDVRARAGTEYHENHSPRRGNRSRQLGTAGHPFQPVVFAAPAATIPTAVTPTIAPNIPVLSTPSPAYQTLLPSLVIPGTTTASSSSSLLTFDSRPVSPAFSDVSLVSAQAQLPKRQHHNQSNMYRSASGSVPPISPMILGHELPWTASDQADLEVALARLTASAGLPLRWVENHEFKVLCDRFLPKAKIPSAKVLTQRIMPRTLNTLKAAAKDDCRGAEATLQCDGWTGENSHHLLAFMMTARRKVNIKMTQRGIITLLFTLF